MDKNTIQQSDYLDIVYDGKNKKYGGYELRRNYSRRLIIGSVVSLLLLGGVFASTLIESKELDEVELVNTEEVKIEDLVFEQPPDIPDAPPPPKQVTVPPPPKPTFKLDPPVIVKNDEVKKENKITDITERPDNSTAGDKLNTENTDPNGSEPGLPTGTGPIGNPPETPVEPPKQNVVERQVDKKAQPPIDVEQFLRSNVVYPEMMAAEGKSGTVIVQFIVRKDGSIDNVKIVKSPDPLFTKEAQRVIKLLQSKGKWTPGEKNGKPVDSYFTQQVRFQLK